VHGTTDAPRAGYTTAAGIAREWWISPGSTAIFLAVTPHAGSAFPLVRIEFAEWIVSG